MRDFIERLQAKPEHERKRIAFFSSIGATAFVAVVWASATLASGTLAIQSSHGAGAGGPTGEIKNAVAESQDSFSRLLGAVGAFQNASSSAASLQIEDVKPAETTSGPDTRTVIPF